jgi:colicin import membrane protein
MRQDNILEQERLLKQREKAHELLMATQADNEKQITYRKFLKQQEIDGDLAIEKYIKERDEKIRRSEALKKAEEQAREMEITKMRVQQEKSANKEAALDALRAKRAAEARERAERKREMDEAEKIRQGVKEMEYYR